MLTKEKEKFIKVPLRRNDPVIKRCYEEVTPLGGIIAGGAARWLTSPADPPVDYGDIDIFCRDQSAYDDVQKLLGRENYRRTKNMCYYGLSYDYHKEGRRPFNLIHPKIMGGPVEKILRSFTFTVCQVALISPTEALVDNDFEEDETERRLRWGQFKSPVDDLKYLIRYIRKGYDISDYELERFIERLE